MEEQSIKKRKRKHRRLTGEDIDMFREKEYYNRHKVEENICDKHIDGA